MKMFRSQKTNQYHFRLIAILVVGVVMVSSSVIHIASAQVMSSGSYSIQADSVNFGGTRSSSGSYALEDTGGEVGTGDLQGTTNILHAGYQQSAAAAAPSTSTSSATQTVSSTSSGGGRLPLNVLNFAATPGTASIFLSWEYPTGSGIQSVRIVRSTTFFPTSLSDGDVIFEGDAQSVIDHNVVKGTRYYYTLFARNTAGFYSSGVLAQAQLLSAGEAVVQPPSNPFEQIPDATDVHPFIANLTLLDFDFIQEGKKIAHAGNTVVIDGTKNLTVQLAYDKVPQLLKTIAISLADPQDETRIFTFLLRVNADQTAYEATIAPLTKSGNYRLHAIVLDYKNQGLKRLQGNLRAVVFEGVAGLLERGGMPAIWLWIVAALIVMVGIVMLVRRVRRNRRGPGASGSGGASPSASGGTVPSASGTSVPIYKKILSLIIIGTMVFVSSGLFASPAHAAINKQINYQGKLADSAGDAVADGTYAMHFNLYTTSSGGSTLWTEDRTGADEVQVTDGLFSVMLGSVTSLASVDFNQTLYLGVAIESDSEMTPRKIIGAVPSAFVADTLDGLDSTQFLRADTGSATIGYFVATSTTASVFPNASTTNITISGKLFDSAGSGGINGQVLKVSGGVPVWGTDNSGGGGSEINWTYFNGSGVYVSTTTNQVLIGDIATTTRQQLEVIGGGYFSGNLGLGTTSPYAKLSVDGRGVFNQDVRANYFTATSTSQASTFPYASTTALTVSGTNGLFLGSLNGPLQANNGVVSATTSIGVLYGGTGLTSIASSSLLIGGPNNTFIRFATSSLGIAISDTTGTLAVNRGGTGWSAIQASAIPYGNGTGALATTTAGTAGYVLAYLNGVPTWAATSSINNGVSSIAQTYGTTQTGAITFATSTATSFNGLTISNAITNSSGTFTFAPNTITGTLTAAGGGTGISSVSAAGVLLGNYAGTGWQQLATSSLGLAISDTTGTLAVNRGGTGLSSYTLGDVLYANGTGSLAGTSTANLKTTLALNNVENTALSTWAGSTNLTTLGTIGTGLWHGTAIEDAYLTKSGNWTGTFDGQEGSYYLDARNLTNFGTPFYTFFSATTTDALTEGASRLYWTNDRFDARLAATTTLPNLTTLLGLTDIIATRATTTNATTTALYISGTVRGAGLTSCSSAADKLTWNSTTGQFGCGTDASGSGSGGGSWSTTTSTVAGEFVNYSNNTTDIVVIGGTSTSTARYWFDPNISTSYLAGNVGIGSTSPSWRLSVAGIGSFDDYVRASYFTATSTSVASTFPYASTTALTVSGTNGLQLATGLNGPLHANAGLISATTSIGVLYGGTGLTSSPSYGNILVGNASGGYTLTATSSLGLPTFSYLFPSNATSTLLSFTGGLISSASTTIGDGTQTGGLTISGGATTTGNAYVAGNLGVGTISPSAKLHVAGSATLDANLSLDESITIGNLVKIARFNGDDATYNDIGFYGPPSTLLMTILNTGNVGIGTSSPYAKLSVDGRGVFNQDVRANYFTATSTSVASTFPYASTTALTVSGTASTTNLIVSSLGGASTRCLQVGTDGTVSANASACGTGGGGTFSWTPTTNYGVTVNATSTPIWFQSGLMASTTAYLTYASSTALTVSGAAYFPGSGVWNSSGFVGIGTSSPYAALSVVGASGVVADKFYATSTTATSTFAGSLNVGNGAIVYDNTTGTTSINYLEAGSMSFAADSGVISWIDLPVTSASANGVANSYSANLNGNALLTIYGVSNGSGAVTNTAVGIGTTSPRWKLAVAGIGSFDDYVRASYFTATSTTASTFPYASTTALTVSGTNGLQLATGLNGPLHANAGLISATTSIGVLYGGTGLTSIASSSLLIGGPNNTFIGFATSSLGIALSDTTGTLAVSRGGTGLSSYTLGDVLYANGTGSLAGTSTANLKTTLALNNVENTALSTWAGSTNLTTLGTITSGTWNGGVIGVPYGGTGWANINAGYIPFGNGASALSTSTNFFWNNTNSYLAIGTSTPYSRLSIWGSSAGTNRLFELTNSASTTLASILENGTAYFLGNVGIGTTSPYASLSVAGASGVVANIYTATSTTATSTFAGGLNVGAGNFMYDLDSGVTTAASFQTGALNFVDDAGLVSWTDLTVTSESPAGTAEGYSANLNGSSTISIYGISNGAGWLQNDFPRVSIGQTGAGTTTPTSKLTVFGNGTGTGGLFELVDNASTTLVKVLDNGKFGIGTTSPNWKLSVAGIGSFDDYVRASYFTATSTTASTFPYASTTALTVSGTNGLQLATGLNGPLHANAGLISATTSIGVLYGGTGLTSSPAYGNILVGNASGGYTLTATSSLGLPTFSYLFPSNATSTLLSFTGGLISSASTTIGNGTQTGGLTISGGATTTGNQYVGGNLGIGTVSPEKVLDIVGNQLANTVLARITNTNSTAQTASGGGIELSADDGAQTAANDRLGYISFAGARNTLGSTLSIVRIEGHAGTTAVTSGNAPSYLSFFTSPSGSATPIEVVRFDQDGSVGIGTSSPYAKLSVDGRGVFNQDVRANYFTATSTSVASTFPYASTTALTVSGTASTTNLIVSSLGGASTRCLQVGTDGTVSANASACGTGGGGGGVGWATTTASNESIYYYGTGNVAIGTSTPYSKLSVWGSGTGTNRLFELTNNASTTLASVLENGTAYFLGNLGVGTTSPNWKLSVAGIGSFDDYVRASYITATSTTATSTFAGGIDVGAGNLLYDFTTGVTSASSFQTGNLNFDTDAGMVSWTDLTLSSASNGTIEGYTASLNGSSTISVYGISAGSGWLQPDYPRVAIGSSTPPSSKLTIFANGTGSGGTFEVANSASTTIFKIFDNGVTGVGTTSPFATFAVNPVAGVASNQFVVGSSTATNFIVTNGGRVGIGTTTPWRTLSVTGTVAVNGLSTGVGGEYAVCIDNVTKELSSAGAQSCLVSSRRFKDDIAPLENGLDEVMKLKPSTFTLKNQAKTGSTTDTHLGFIAEEVDGVDKRLVQYEADGITPRTVRYEEVTALLAKAIQEQQLQIGGLASTTVDLAAKTSAASLSTVAAQANASLLTSNVDAQMSAQISGIDERVSDMQERISTLSASTTLIDALASSTADRLASSTAEAVLHSSSFLEKIFSAFMDFLASAVARIKSVFVGELHVEDKLCVDDVCINKDQLKALLVNAGGVSSTTPAAAVQSNTAAVMTTQVNVPAITPAVVPATIQASPAELVPTPAVSATTTSATSTSVTTTVTVPVASVPEPAPAGQQSPEPAQPDAPITETVEPVAPAASPVPSEPAVAPEPAAVAPSAPSEPASASSDPAPAPASVPVSDPAPAVTQ